MSYETLRALQADIGQVFADLLAKDVQIAMLQAQIDQLYADRDSPSGQALPKNDLPGWRYLMGEDFRTDVAVGGPLAVTYPNIGWYPNTFKDTSKKGIYDTAKVVSVSGGVLRKHIHTADRYPRVAAMVPYISPPTTTSRWPGQLYGRYAVRAKFPTALPGFKIAWLLWPDTGTNTTGSASGTGGNGEIDFPETNLSALLSVGGYVHYQDATVNSDQYAMPRAAVDMTEWHTYVTEWSPGLVSFLIDDEEVGVCTTRVPNTPMHWVLQTETSLTTTYPDPAVQGDVLIDWVAIWALAQSA